MDFSPPLLKEIQKKYNEKAVILGSFMDEITSKISKINDENIRHGMMFLYGHLPLSDIGEEDTYDILFATLRHAFFLRGEMPWSKDIPFDMFLADVLFPRVGNEKLEDNRRYFYDLLAPRIKGKPLAEAIIEINYFCFENATYQSTDRRTAPPKTLMTSGAGRCGEEAVFTVTALRSVGIPARPLYTPRWAHCDDNHAWVEAYTGKDWAYLGACEPEEALNRGWFTSAASRAMLIESRAFYHNKHESADEAIEDGIVYNLNHTARYAHTRHNRISVVDQNNKPIENVQVILEIINYGSFSPIAELITDKNGEVQITTGLGSLNIHLVYKGRHMERLVNTAKEKGFLLKFEPEILSETTVEFDAFAPKDPGNKVESLPKEAIQKHKEKLLRGTKRREDKLKNSIIPLPDLELAKAELDMLTNILDKAKSNGNQILRFLQNNVDAFPWAWKLLLTLNDKDYTDLDEVILQSHLDHAIQYKANYNADIFTKYILSPRIYFEPLTSFRPFIDSYFDDTQKKTFREAPDIIWSYIQSNMKYLPDLEFPGVHISPAGALKTGYASPLAQKILFVAIARTLGVPARIRKDTEDIEYYHNGGFQSPVPAEIRDAFLKINFQKNTHWAYGTNWSLSRFDEGIFKPLNLRNMAGGLNELRLKRGWYRLQTGNRLPCGDIFANKYVFELKSGERKEIPVTLRPLGTADMRSPVEIGDFYVKDQDGKEVSVSDLLSDRENILIWLKPNDEPCTHILNELMAHKAALSGIHIVFLAAEKAVYENLLIQSTAEAVQAKKLIDTNFTNREPTARRTYVNPENLPLTVLTRNKLNSFFAISGYNVGTVELLIKLFS